MKTAFLIIKSTILAVAIVVALGPSLGAAWADDCGGLVGYVWVPPHENARGEWIPGRFWACGCDENKRTWIPPRVDEDGRFVPGYFIPPKECRKKRKGKDK
jgi:hypothetical protein